MTGQPEQDRPLLVEVWSDIACPWCLIGMRRFDRALTRFEHADQVTVRWRSFELNPQLGPETVTPQYEFVAAKMGGTIADARGRTAQLVAMARQEGLDYDFDNALVTSTFDAHRLTHLGAAHGLGTQMHEQLMIARQIEGKAVNDTEVLVEAAVRVGLAEAEVREVLAGDRYADDVRHDIREAAQLGVNGVPFFVLNRRFGLSGAQQPETFLAALDQAYQDTPAARRISSVS